MRRFTFVCCISMLMLAGCMDSNYPFPQADISVTEKEQLRVHRYGKALFELDTADFQNGLASIQDDFRLFLDADLSDTANVNQLYSYVTDSQLVHIYSKVLEVYPDLSEFEGQLSEAFSRHAYYYSESMTPDVYSYVSDLYFEAPVVIRDQIMLIAIDVYLGADFPLYMHLGLPLYKIRCMEPENMIVDAMKARYFNDVHSSSRLRTLLDRMIEGGKLLAYLDAVLPLVHDSLKICYSEQKLRWAEKNQQNVWAFLVENELLFSTDYQVQTKMIQDGPFTTGFSNRSPSRLGVFIGWQIVRAYLRNNPDVTMQEMMVETDSQKILTGSQYRP